jgi:hypothetical protein
MEQFAAFVAIDCSDAKHDICLLDVATGKKEAGILKHTPEELEARATAFVSLTAWGWSSLCGTSDGRHGHWQRPMDHGGGTALLLRGGSCDGAQWEVHVDPMALLLSEVSAAVVP